MDTATFTKYMASDPGILPLSFVIAVVLVVFLGPLLVRTLYRLILHTSSVLAPADGDPTATKTLYILMGEIYGTKQHEREAPGARVIGGLEGTLYVFGLMFGQPVVISGVIIFKAFFTWATINRTAQAGQKSEALTTRDVITGYYVYLIGNFLSLLVALAIGEMGIWLFPRLLSRWLACHAMCQ